MEKRWLKMTKNISFRRAEFTASTLCFRTMCTATLGDGNDINTVIWSKCWEPWKWILPRSVPETPRSKSCPFLWQSKRSFPFHSRSHCNLQEFHSVLRNCGGLSGNSAIACNKFINFKIGPRGRLIAEIWYFYVHVWKQIVETLSI